MSARADSKERCGKNEQQIAVNRSKIKNMTAKVPVSSVGFSSIPQCLSNGEAELPQYKNGLAWCFVAVELFKLENVAH